MNARAKQNVAVISSLPVQALRLRPLREEDEAAFAAGHRAMAAEGFTFGLGYEPGKPWHTYLRELEDHRQGRNLPARHVPGIFLVAEVAGEIVGRTSIRFRLNDFLAEQGGHIGYAVLPQHRKDRQRHIGIVGVAPERISFGQYALLKMPIQSITRNRKKLIAKRIPH